MALRTGLSLVCRSALRPSLRPSLLAQSQSIAGAQWGRCLSDETSAEDVKSRIDRLVAANKVVVFMKGDPQQPRCGFSNAVVQVLRMHGVPYEAHDVLSSEELRKGIKDYTNWPTIPQVFVNGEFIGGCDILLEKHQNGELIEDLKKVGITSALLEEQLSKDNNDKQ